jgi:hypothetical protein
MMKPRRLLESEEYIQIHSALSFWLLVSEAIYSVKVKILTLE